jgi:hypothetical protein
MSTDEQPRVTHETLRSLEPNDVEYFTALGLMLNGHRNILNRVASDAGVDMITRYDIASGGVKRDEASRAEINECVARLLSVNGPAPEVRWELEASTSTIYNHIATRSTVNATTNRAERSGLRVVGERMSAYYNAILSRSTLAPRQTHNAE